MNAGFKDSPEIIEFQKQFARLKDWSEDDPAGLSDLARGDNGIEELCLSVLKAAGSVQKSEQSERDLFTGPVDPKFIFEWRDFEERFASPLLNVRSNMSAVGGRDFSFSFDYYEEPDQWEVADFRAVSVAQSFDAVIWFATVHAKKLLEDRPGLNSLLINPKALSDRAKRAYSEMAKLAGNAEDSYEELRDNLLSEIRMSDDESHRSQLRNYLAKVDQERLGLNNTPLEDVAEDGWPQWERQKYESGIDLRGVIRRRALIPFILFPRHVSARLSSTDLPSIYQNLRQAHEAFVSGVHFAALALMRSVMEMMLRDHYAASGVDLSALINSVADQLPQRANAAALHRLRKLANEVLHGNPNRTGETKRAAKRDLEREIVSLFFVLRALVEGVPQFRAR